MLINVKMPTIVGILTFMSRINFVLFDSTIPITGLGLKLEGKVTNLKEKLKV